MSRVEAVTCDLFTGSENLPKRGRATSFKLPVTQRAMEESKKSGSWCPKLGTSPCTKPLASIGPGMSKERSSLCFDKTLLVL